jgi:hypothetical protein
MLFVWSKGISQPSAYKCHELPSNGSGKVALYIVKHTLREAEEGLPIRDLEKIYPCPEYATAD